MSARYRFMRAFAAQIYTQVSSIAIQLALVPVLIHAWGTTLYGTWLLLSAVPFYLTFSDFGFTFIAKNDMVMAVANGNRPAALRTFQSILVMLSLALPAVFLVIVGPALLLDLSALLSLQGYPNAQTRLVFALLVANVVLYQYVLLISAGLRAENRPATEMTLGATSRLGEGLVIALVALGGAGLVGAAAAALVNRIVFLAITLGWMRRVAPWVKLGWREARLAEIRRLFHPALAYMFMPLSQALLIQGPVLVIGHLLDPLSVVVFSTSRTLARLGTAATTIANGAFITEYAARAGQNDVAGFTRLLRGHLALCVAAVLAYGAIILVLDDRLMRLFTHGRVPIIEPFFALVVAGVAAEMVWTTLFTAISAVNRHRLVTYVYFALCCVGIVVSYPLVRHFGIAGAAGFVLAVNGAIIPVAAVFGRPSRLLKDHARRMRTAFAGSCA